MASTLVATNAGSGKQARNGIGIVSVTSKYSLTAALVINDVIQMVKIPKGAVIQEVILAAGDLDTASSPAIKLIVGDGDDTDRFIKDASGISTIAQGGGVARMNNQVGAGHQYAADDTIDVKVDTAPTTGTTSGDITLTVIYSMHDDV